MRCHNFARIIVSFVLLAFSSAGATTSPFFNVAQIRQNLGLSFLRQQFQRPPQEQVRIAVLDRGFMGYEDQIGQTLPATTRYFGGPLDREPLEQTDHGLVMAQLIHAMLEPTELKYTIELHNAAGFTNFKHAVKTVIENGVDVVLYAEVWDYGNNFDGQGFINEVVSQATSKGILWINAAGNFAQGVYNTRIQKGDEDWVRLPDENNALKIFCRSPQGEKCRMRIVASWNDFKNDESVGTDKDIDIALFDDFMSVVQTAALRQSSDEEMLSRPGHSRYPREIILAEVDAGTYFLKAKARSDNFDFPQDLLRFSISGEHVQLRWLDVTENLHNPADHPDVITVGASDSNRSSVSRILGKPEVWLPSSVYVERGEFRGSSNSAAMIAAKAAYWRGFTTAPFIRR